VLQDQTHLSLTAQPTEDTRKSNVTKLQDSVGVLMAMAMNWSIHACADDQYVKEKVNYNGVTDLRHFTVERGIGTECKDNNGFKKRHPSQKLH
jgi:hypothetical protein